MKVGDRVKCKNIPFGEGKIITIGIYPGNLYTVMVRCDNGEVHNFKPEHLEVIHK